jgi:uncharacterized protein YegP (UPF0339 family)
MATERKCRFDVYQDAARSWRWRLKDTNGKIVADSAEGYTTREGAEAGIRDVRDCCGNAEIVSV